jgi:hypothetical protein
MKSLVKNCPTHGLTIYYIIIKAQDKEWWRLSIIKPMDQINCARLLLEKDKEELN